jgi:polyisoprenoid-binding protein YceI
MAWKFDYAHSEITFAVKHMMISTVRGRFEKFTGEIVFNEDAPATSSVMVEIDTSSINTNNEQRDGHLRSPDFLNHEQFPTMTFKSTRIEDVSGNEAKIVGDLTIRGVTKEVVLDTEFAGKVKSPFGFTSAGFSATTEINRTEWGLVWNAALETGGVLVGEKIKILLEVELIEEA